MSAAEKAIARIRRHRPKDIDLTLYPTEALFHRFYPGQSYAAHKAERARVVEYCAKHRIMVHDVKITEDARSSAAQRAAYAVKPPTRLGLNFASDRFNSALGWWLISLKPTSSQGGEE